MNIKVHFGLRGMIDSLLFKEDDIRSSRQLNEFEELLLLLWLSSQGYKAAAKSLSSISEGVPIITLCVKSLSVVVVWVYLVYIKELVTWLSWVDWHDVKALES